MCPWRFFAAELTQGKLTIRGSSSLLCYQMSGFLASDAPCVSLKEKMLAAGISF